MTSLQSVHLVLGRQLGCIFLPRSHRKLHPTPLISKAAAEEQNWVSVLLCRTFFPPLSTSIEPNSLWILIPNAPHLPGNDLNNQHLGIVPSQGWFPVSSVSPVSLLPGWSSPAKTPPTSATRTEGLVRDLGSS